MRLLKLEFHFFFSTKKELFIEFLSKESYKFTSQGSRKTIQRKDIGKINYFLFKKLFKDFNFF